MRLAAAAALLAAALLAAPAVRAADPPAAAPAQPDYHPSFGDLMTMAVQPRHIKLGLGGKARNWAYAAYESSELRNAFARVGRTIPTYRKQALPEVFAANVATPLDQVDAAIKAKDGKAFDAAYTTLTQACNVCHQALEHPMVVIREPAGPFYPDQVFTPPK